MHQIFDHDSPTKEKKRGRELTWTGYVQYLREDMNEIDHGGGRGNSVL